MRDKLKDKEYFKRFLEYQYQRIEKKEKKLIESDNDKKQRILLSLTGYEIDLLKAEFSAGASAEKLKSIYIHTIDVVNENRNITYDDLLTLLSLGIILDAESESRKLLLANRDIICGDRLLNYLASYIDKGERAWEPSAHLAKEYELLDRVFDAKDREEALDKYLANWYDAHSGYAWYDSHLRDSDTYCGYWSFESAAIVKIEKLDIGKVKHLEYYPQL